jgi:hypothetical protein
VISNAGTVTVDLNGALVVDNGIVKNTGAINVSGDLFIGANTYPPAPVLGTVTLEGGGAVVLPAPQPGSVTGLIVGNGTLTNVDNTISGAGSIDVTLVNETGGVINANVSASQPLEFNYVDGSGHVSNFGTIESTGSGYLTIVQDRPI